MRWGVSGFALPILMKEDAVSLDVPRLPETTSKLTFNENF